MTAIITFISIACIFIFVPESLTTEKRTKQITWKSFNTFTHLKEIFSIKTAKSLIIMGAFFYIGLGIWQFNASIFLKDVFKWGPEFIGGVFVLVGICDILSRVIILPQMLKKYSEQTVGIIGLLGLVVGLGLLFISAFITSVFFIVGAVACIVLGEGLFDPSYNARLSNTVTEDKQGLLQGTSQSLQALYHVLVPLGAAAIYSYNKATVFGIATILMICGLLLFINMNNNNS